MVNNLEHKRLLYRTAKAYYDDGLTQQQIGERFGLSRVKISRLLREAREDKVVQITIASPPGSNADLERQLESLYGLKEALVVTCSGADTSTIVGQLGPAAAACLARCLQGKEVVALSWGTAVLSVVNALSPMNLPDVRVVQFLGGLGELEAETHGAELARRMAQALGAKPRLIHAPGIVKDQIVRDALAMDPQVADTLELAGRADVALVGIGVFEPDATLLSSGNALTAEEIDSLRSSGVAGDIALQFFDGEGRKVRHPIDDRIVGTNLDRIKQIPRVIGVAGGQAKTRVIRAALRGGLVNVLVTDSQTAGQLLESGDSHG
jgi:DNA-binding transcriptional regulator LsrR (DeoR family)